jgi:ribosomal protein S27AE
MISEWAKRQFDRPARNGSAGDAGNRGEVLARNRDECGRCGAAVRLAWMLVPACHECGEVQR